MIETFRMLGHEREADLAREADRRRLAAALPRRRRRLRIERLLTRFRMNFVDRVRWAVRGKDAGSGHSSAMGATEDAVHAPSSVAERHKASF